MIRVNGRAHWIIAPSAYWWYIPPVFVSVLMPKRICGVRPVAPVKPRCDLEHIPSDVEDHFLAIGIHDHGLEGHGEQLLAYFQKPAE